MRSVFHFYMYIRAYINIKRNLRGRGGGNPCCLGAGCCCFSHLHLSKNGFAEIYLRRPLSPAGRSWTRSRINPAEAATVHRDLTQRLRGRGGALAELSSLTKPRRGLFPGKGSPARFNGSIPVPRSGRPPEERGGRRGGPRRGGSGGARTLIGNDVFIECPSWVSSLEIPEDGSICPCFRCHFLFLLGSPRLLGAAFPLGRAPHPRLPPASPARPLNPFRPAHPLHKPFGDRHKEKHLRA